MRDAHWHPGKRWPLIATLLLPPACVIQVDGPELDTSFGPRPPIEGSSGDVLDESDTGSPEDTGSSDSGPSPFDETGVDAELRYLAVTPGDAVLELDLDAPASHALTVTGVHADGTTVDLTAEATWSCSNPALGTVNGSTLEIPAFSATTIGSTVITAEARGFYGEAQVTVAAYRQTGEQADFFFVLPHSDPAGPQHEPLTFGTDVKALDVFMAMDTTGSMGEPIENLQDTLAGTVIPGIQASVPNTQFGVGAVEDFPLPPFGSNPCFVTDTPDQPFQLLQSITPVLGAAQAAVDALTTPGGQPIGCGADWPEAQTEALYQIATGEGLSGPGQTNVASHAAGVGGVGFREGSMPVIVLVSDAPSHDPGEAFCYGGPDYASNPGIAAVAHTRQEAEDALSEICARVVTVAVQDFDACSAYSDGLALAEGTHALIPPVAWDLAPGGRPPACEMGECCTGIDGDGVVPDGDGMCPLVYRSTAHGEGVGAGMVDGVSLLAGYSPFAVATEVDGVDADVDGELLPAGHTTADFILDVVPLGHGPVPLPGVPAPVLTPDGFEGVIPDTDVTFTITAYNHVVPQGPAPRIFEATIRVLADGCSDLDERTVYILVPPEPLHPPG